MMYSALLVAAAAVASAQVVYNSTTNVFTCSGNPNGDYCAGDSLGTNIIIRCTDGVGQPGNCNANLSGYFPYGSNGAVCWQTSATSGDAACAKNCIVEGGSGNSPTFTLPNCTPLLQSSTTVATSTPEPTTTITYINPFPTTTPEPTTTITYINPFPTSSTTVTKTYTTTTCYTTDGTTITETLTSTTTYCPGTTSTSVPVPTTTPCNSTTTAAPTTTITYILPTGGSSSYTNGTTTTTTTASSVGPSSFVTSAVTTVSSATNVPVGPTSTKSAPPPGFTGAAAANTAGMGVAVLGLFMAYFL